MNTKLQIALVITIALLLIIIGPLVCIWALNTLFAVGIAYNFWTWLAAFWFLLVVGGIKSR